MTSDQPKVSFIPKNSLVRDESFLERPRPRSLLGFLAVVSILASFGAYGGLRFFDYTLNKQIDTRQEEVKKARDTFTQSPEITKAKNFQARAELAQELLDGHIVVSPIFAFLQKNTLASVYFSSFSFKQTEKGLNVELVGEAPSYASLAYQADILSTQTDELSHVSFSNISLTKFGSVAFSLSLTFTPEYLSYTKEREIRNTVSTPATTTPMSTDAVMVPPVSITPKPSIPMTQTSSTTIVLPFINTQTVPASSASTSGVAPQSSAVTDSQEIPAVSELPSIEAPASVSWWSWFKFW